MGAATCAAVSADPELELVARVGHTDELRAFADAHCDVVVDFTTADARASALPWLAMHGVHAVVGTTGLTAADLDSLRATFGNGPAHCLIAPNFAISAVLMMRFAEIAAPYFDTAEIIEYHHDRKIDAPSGTAVSTAERMAAARGDVAWAPDPTEREVLPACTRRRRRGSGGRARPFRPNARDGGAPGRDPRRRRPVAHDPPGQLRPRELHAGVLLGVQANRRPPRLVGRGTRTHYRSAILGWPGTSFS
jgi:hypothetical protein